MASLTTIPGSECQAMTSKVTGREYEVSIWRPEGVSGPLPVLVVSDGNVVFPMATSIVSLMILGAEMTPVQIVGIGYPTGADVNARLALRRRDLIPARRDDPSLGAEGFVGFLRDELCPWLEQNYEVTNERTLYGTSLGGLFALYVLLNHPELFGRYIIVSPAVVADAGFYDDSGWSDEAQPPSDVVVSLSAGEQEAELSAALAPELAASFAALDAVNHTRRIDALLRSSGEKGRRLSTVIVPNQSHFTMPAIGLALGLRHVFA